MRYIVDSDAMYFPRSPVSQYQHHLVPNRQAFNSNDRSPYRQTCEYGYMIFAAQRCFL